MKSVNVKKINFRNEKYYNKYIFNVLEDGNVIYSNSIKVEKQEIENMIKYTACIRQNKGCMISTNMFAEKDNYNIDDIINYLGYYLIQNKIRIKNERLKGRLNSFKQISKYIYKYENKKDITKFERIIGEINCNINKNTELMKLFDYASIGFSITKEFSEDHKRRFYSLR